MMTEQASDLIFINVNEEGDAYGFHDSMDAALPQLDEFPNDTIVVCTQGSPTHDLYRRSTRQEDASS